jgi:hypothetical protein
LLLVGTCTASIFSNSFFISIQVKVLRERLTNEIKVERERRKRVEEKVRFNDL